MAAVYSRPDAAKLNPIMHRLRRDAKQFGRLAETKKVSPCCMEPGFNFSHIGGDFPSSRPAFPWQFRLSHIQKRYAGLARTKPEAIRSRGRNGGLVGGGSILASRIFLIFGLTGRSALPFYGRAALLRRLFGSAATDGRL